MRSKNKRATLQNVLEGEYTVIGKTNAPLAQKPVTKLSIQGQAIVENTNEQLLIARARQVLAHAGEQVTEDLVRAQMNRFMEVAEALDAQATSLENAGRADDVQQYIKDKLEDYAAIQKQRLHRINQTLAELEQQDLLTEEDKTRPAPLISINLG